MIKHIFVCIPVDTNGEASEEVTSIDNATLISTSEPTKYQGSDVGYLLYANDGTGGIDRKAYKDLEECPLLPKNEADMRAFAKMFGWTVKVKSGTMVLVTDVKAGQ